MREVRPPPYNAFVLHRLIKRFSCGQLERCAGMVKSGLASCLFTNPYCTVIVYNYVYIVGTEWCLLILNILIVYGVINQLLNDGTRRFKPIRPIDSEITEQVSCVYLHIRRNILTQPFKLFNKSTCFKEKQNKNRRNYRDKKEYSVTWEKGKRSQIRQIRIKSEELEELERV